MSTFTFNGKMNIFCLLLVFYLSIGCQAQQYCNREWYDIQLLQCCGDFELCALKERKCCGRHCYGLSASLCCEGSIIDKCSQFYADCCGKKCIDRKDKVCCNGKIMDACASVYSGCCDGQCFDTRTHICCTGQIVYKCADDRSAACCKYQCFNNRTDTCCDGYYTVSGVCPENRCCGPTCCQSLTTIPIGL